MCSSVLSSLLLISSTVFFISVIVFFSSVWLFFILSSTLLKFSLCSPIFPNLVSILITNAMNSLSGVLFISLSLVVYSGIFSCSFK